MRKELKQIEEVRTKFSGTFERFGWKKNYKGPPTQTVLLKNLKDDNGNILTDHAWFNYGKNFEKIGELKEGDEIYFYARIKKYKKGYYKNDIDYRFSHATRFKKISNI